jgi:chromosomal replication initiation ATPase DnaA
VRLDPNFAHEARIASLESQLRKAIERIAALEKPKPKPKPRIMDKAEHDAHVAMSEIAKTVAQQYGMTVERLKSHDRRTIFSVPRRKAWKLCHDAGYSLPMIGRCFGGRDHTTILHGIRRLEAMNG